MKKSQVIAALEQFQGDPEVCVVVDKPNNPPYQLVSVEPDDFDEVDRIAFVTNLKELE